MSFDTTWEKIHKERDWGKYPSEDLIRFIAKNFYDAPDRSSVRILELGCGIGANLWYLAREGFTAYGIDGSETAIGKCKNWLGSSVCVHVGDMVDLPYSDGMFDAVIDVQAAGHNSYEDSVKIYAEAARVLKPNGKIFSRTFAEGCHEGIFEGKGYYRLTKQSAIPELLAEFNIEEVEMLTRTIDNQQHEIKEWVISGAKR